MENYIGLIGSVTVAALRAGLAKDTKIFMVVRVLPRNLLVKLIAGRYKVHRRHWAGGCRRCSSEQPDLNQGAHSSTCQ